MRREYLDEFLKRRANAPEVAPPYIEALFPQQRAFVSDPAKRKAALCTRRSGKTEAVAAWLLDGARTCPGGLSVYIARSRNNARLILWSTLARIDQRHNLGLWLREIDGQLMVELPNQHRIWLAGCGDVSEIDKFRGVGGTKVAGIRRAAVDEAQAFPDWLRTLINDVLSPALMDQNGELALIGTPGPIPAGPFYEVTTGDSGESGLPMWSTHSWSVLDNTYLPEAAQWLAEERKRMRWDDNHPTYRREWLGQWVRDDNALVYPYSYKRNVLLDIGRDANGDLTYEPSGVPPSGDYIHILAVDLGTSEKEASTAFCVVGFRRGHPEIYVMSCYKRAGYTPQRTAAEIAKLRATYRPSRIVVDAGGLGGGYVKEFNERYGFAVEAAEKQHKRGFIEIVAGEMLSGLIKVLWYECQPLIDEWMMLPWDEKRELPDTRFVDHCSDATLYAIRAAKAYYRPELEGPKPGTPEALNAESLTHKRQLVKQVEKVLAKKWQELQKRAYRSGRS